MLLFAKLSTVPEKKFVRTVGSHKEDFLSLHSKVTDYSEAEKNSNPLKKTREKIYFIIRRQAVANIILSAALPYF
jgi:hypothetical protein